MTNFLFWQTVNVLVSGGIAVVIFLNVRKVYEQAQLEALFYVMAGLFSATVAIKAFNNLFTAETSSDVYGILFRVALFGWLVVNAYVAQNKGISILWVCKTKRHAAEALTERPVTHA